MVTSPEIAMAKEIVLTPRKKTPEQEMADMAEKAKAKNRKTGGTPKGKLNAKEFKCAVCGHIEDAPIKIFHHRRKEHPGATVTADKNRKAKEKRAESPRSREGGGPMVKPNASGTLEERREYQRRWRAKRMKEGRPIKKKKASRAYHRIPASNGNGSHPPIPLRFCVQCGERLPTMELKGKEFPAAFPYCGFCGAQLPTLGGK